jgi:hypothetical protein
MKENAKLILVASISIILSSTIAITATTMIQSSSVSYDNTTVDAALDNLFDVVDLQEQIDALKTSSLSFDTIYPVGSIYISTSNTNPSSLFGGTWKSYGTGRTLIGAGSNGTTSYTAGSEGGNVSGTVTLENTNLPDHTHTTSATTTSTVNLTANSNGAHTHLFSRGGQAMVVSSETDIATESTGLPTDKGIVMSTSEGFARGYNKTVSPIASAGTHTHTVTGSVTIPSLTTSYCTDCNGTAFSTQDAYVVVYIWKRTK